MTIEGLRPARDEDAAALFALIATAYADYPGCVLDVEEEPALRRPSASFRDGGGWWAVVRGGRLVASASLSPSASRANWGQLEKLYVARECRGQGLGGTLVAFVEAQARERGWRRLHLWSDCRFTEAHRLYRRLGWWQSPLTRPLADRSRTSELEFLRRL